MLRSDGTFAKVVMSCLDHVCCGHLKLFCDKTPGQDISARYLDSNDMAARSKPLVAQQRLPVPSSEDKGMYMHLVVRLHWACSNPSKRILGTANVLPTSKTPVSRRRRRLRKSLHLRRATSNKWQVCDSVCRHKWSNDTQEQVVEGNSSRRSLRPRTGNRKQTTASSAQKAATRKRPWEPEAEQTADLRRTEQPRIPDQQLKGKKRRIDTLDSIYLGSTEAPQERARRDHDKSVVDNSVDQEEEASKVDEDERDLISY